MVARGASGYADRNGRVLGSLSGFQLIGPNRFEHCACRSFGIGRRGSVTARSEVV
jgi:hypothetical protein